MGKQSLDSNIPTDIERGKRIESLRRKKAWTQEEFAKKIGKSKGMVSNYENGHGMRLDTLMSMSSLFQVSQNYILTGERDMSPQLFPSRSIKSPKNFEELHERFFEVYDKSENIIDPIVQELRLLSLSMIEDIEALRANLFQEKIRSRKKESGSSG